MTDRMIRAFRIVKDPWDGCWRWECSLCQPPAHGARHGDDAYERIVQISLPRHMERRRCHHAYVARRGLL